MVWLSWSLAAALMVAAPRLRRSRRACSAVCLLSNSRRLGSYLAARAAAAFWPSCVLTMAFSPLIGRTLRYYVRSNKVRFNYIAAIPLLGFLTFRNPTSGGPLHYFVRALGAFAVAGFLGTAVMST